MNQLHILPEEVLNLVDDYVNGTKEYWKGINNKVIHSIWCFNFASLRSPAFYRLDNSRYWCGSCVYCETCGEKQKPDIFSNNCYNCKAISDVYL